jgi:hypothetical protein
VKNTPPAEGQAAMEYIMTYGWAIMVVLIVGVLIWQLGLFHFGGSMVTPTGFAKLKPQLTGTGLSRSGVFTGMFTNGCGTSLFVTGVRVVNVDSNTTLCCSHTTGMPADCTGNAGADVGGKTFTELNGGDSADIKAGDIFTVKLGSGTPSNCQITGAAAGGIYNIRVEIFYDLVLGGIRVSRTDTGTLRGPFE